MKYNKLAIDSKEKLMFGKALYPVTTNRGLVIGDGHVYPELNFTLPTIDVNREHLEEIKTFYKEIVTEALERSIDLHSEGLIFEFETLIEMTLDPDIGIELVKAMNDICEDYYQKKGVKSEIRLTPNDIRDFEKPPKCRTSKYLDDMWRLFDEGARAGGDLLSIESIGGKDIHDEALLMCDIKKMTYALTVLGVRDMKMLWKKIVSIANSQNKIPAGDTACGFANTAMVLAEKKYIPKTVAAIDRILSIVRTLVAIEEGARGPDKDCGYEGVYLKAITGTPISMEGKTAACAHLSPVGNIASACADLWSNESVQHIKLLAGNAPLVYYEQLEYDARLLNEAIKQGDNNSLILQNMLVESDIHYDPQALILSPENVIRITSEIVKGKNYIDAAIKGALEGIKIIEDAHNNGSLFLSDMEPMWIDTIREQLNDIPLDESKFTEQMLPELDTAKFIPSEYGL